MSHNKIEVLPDLSAHHCLTRLTLDCILAVTMKQTTFDSLTGDLKGNKKKKQATTCKELN